jgi:hypothetical protein
MPWPHKLILKHRIHQICNRYVTIFGAFVTLTAQEEETMIFSKYVGWDVSERGADAFTYSSLLRLRQEVSKLILKHTEKIDDPAARSTTQEKFYELLLSGLSVGHFRL